MKFTYSSGARPLDGYTIKRGIGHGGFGEVYYALSDAGKEVALKLVRSNLEVELRGMAQCLNLKHPNLVALYDIKTDAQGESWVIMEYVGGESLSNVLRRYPQGLPPDLVRQWFVPLARGCGNLHDNGIVHRDLKPGNIFLENGIVKVGDYGLCKFISGSQRSAQTQSVGTVHYMAPEISTGNYGKAVDIYAAGVILYEMLTGKVPFDGESAGEILMKHLTTPPDLSKVPAGYREIVGTALAKNPAHRYPSLGDMAKAVEQVATNGVPMVVPVEPLPPPQGAEVPFVLPAGVSGRARLVELSGALVLSAIAAALGAGMWIMAAAQIHAFNWDTPHIVASWYATFFLTLLASWVALVPAKFWEQRNGDQWLRRGSMLVLGLLVGVCGYWLNGWPMGPGTPALPPETSSLAPLLTSVDPVDDGFPVHLFRYMTYFGIALCAVRWWKLAERNRQRRFSFYPVLLVALASWLLYGIIWASVADTMGYEGLQAPIALTLAAVIVQVVSPWEAPAPKPVRRLRLRYA
jgi:hypothetical protein